MENGGVNLDNQFAGLGLNDTNDGNYNNLSHSTSSNDGLFQVMKAVEAAEATIKQQVEENVRLRGELEKKIEELDRYKTADLKGRIHNQVDHMVDSAQEPCRDTEIVSDFGNLANEKNGSNHDSSHAISDTISLHKDLVRNNKDAIMQHHSLSPSEVDEGNDNLTAVFGAQASAGNPGLVQLSPPAMTSFSPTRYQRLGEFNPDGSISGRGLMTLNNIGSLNQDLALKIQDHEEEIMRLRQHVAEYSAKEAQIQNEKYILEKRIAYMRMAFDQQQQDLVDATSKAISYRQDIMEENIRLTYALQAAQHERSTFISSLVPLLAEYSFEPPVADAQSIASNVKVLFRHMQEKLLVTEAKLKESQYQLAPLLSDVYPLNTSPSPSHSFGMKNGLELVAQPSYSNANNPLSSDIQSSPDWGLLGHHQSDTVGGVKSAEADGLGRYSPIASRDSSMQNLQMHAVSQAELHSRIKEETSSKQVKFKDLVSSEMEESDPSGGQNDMVPPVSRTSRNPVYTAAVEDPSTSFSSYLPPVLEEPSSSFSEDEDPLPAIEGLQISGEAFPGRILQASGYSINGTTSCNFEWIRHLEDGSFNYIDGAKQPNYLVTADDVDTYLAIEVQPLDNRKRKGELVKVFANEHRKIGCDPEVQACIEKALYVGHASFKVSISPSGGYLGIWEPAKLGIKRDGYSIKGSRPSGVLVSEKFSPNTIVSVRYGSPTEFSIIGSEEKEHLLRAENVTDTSCSRDAIVLTLRIFLVRASEKKKGKKRGLFFHK